MRIPAVAGFHPRVASSSAMPATTQRLSDDIQGYSDPADRCILVLGSPRSGTTWLAKILDSHPDVLYRHEPDEVRGPVAGLEPRQQLHVWINERCPRVSAVPPLFGKSWQPLPVALARGGIVQLLKAASRLPVGGQWLGARSVPDFVAIDRRPELRIVLKLVNWNASATLRAVPNSRCLFILRHPCGQIASAMVGAAQGRFSGVSAGSLSAAEEAIGVATARHYGTNEDSFQRLPEAARLAWVWRGFNEAMATELLELPNACLVLYEDLCDQPDVIAQNLFDFAGLGWHPQTDEFLARSTQHKGSSDYFAVFRSSSLVARQWRTTMPQADQEAIRSVIRGSPLALHWDDLRG
jgi:hypothetical protein